MMAEQKVPLLVSELAVMMVERMDFEKVVAWVTKKADK
jgi:hypothetical protein